MPHTSAGKLCNTCGTTREIRELLRCVLAELSALTQRDPRSLFEDRAPDEPQGWTLEQAVRMGFVDGAAVARGQTPIEMIDDIEDHEDESTTNRRSRAS